jgi:outer membrane immunogenic protein
LLAILFVPRAALDLIVLHRICKSITASGASTGGGWVMRQVALLGAVALSVGFVHGALAAELPVYPAPVPQGPPVYAAPVYAAPIAVAPTWTGLYLGFNAGWSWIGSSGSIDRATFAFTGPFGVFNARPVVETFTSPVFGGQFGYNLQTGNWIWGIEGDVDDTNLRVERKVTIPSGTAVPAGTGFLNGNQTWLASAKGRIGYTWGQAMVFGEFGVAWSGFNVDGGATVQGAPPVTFNSQFMKRGVVMGGGFAWMLSPNWSMRAEALSYTFNGATFHQAVIPGTNVTLNTASDKFTDIVARIGLDYKFDIGAPVQTRY